MKRESHDLSLLLLENMKGFEKKLLSMGKKTVIQLNCISKNTLCKHYTSKPYFILPFNYKEGL